MLPLLPSQINQHYLSPPQGRDSPQSQSMLGNEFKGVASVGFGNMTSINKQLPNVTDQGNLKNIISENPKLPINTSPFQQNNSVVSLKHINGQVQDQNYHRKNYRTSMSEKFIKLPVIRNSENGDNSTNSVKPGMQMLKYTKENVQRSILTTSLNESLNNRVGNDSLVLQEEIVGNSGSNSMNVLEKLECSKKYFFLLKKSDLPGKTVSQK